MFEDQSDNVSNLGYTGVVFTCCRLPFAAPRGQGGGVKFGQIRVQLFLENDKKV